MPKAILKICEDCGVAQPQTAFQCRSRGGRRWRAAVCLGCKTGSRPACFGLPLRRQSLEDEIDWRPYIHLDPDRILCRCGETYFSHTQIVGGRLYSERTCPGCGYSRFVVEVRSALLLVNKADVRRFLSHDL